MRNETTKSDKDITQSILKMTQQRTNTILSSINPRDLVTGSKDNTISADNDEVMINYTGSFAKQSLNNSIGGLFTQDIKDMNTVPD